MKYYFLICIFCFKGFFASAQEIESDKIYMPNIHGVKLFVSGNQLSYPIINLGAPSALELHFDDLDARVKNYYYTFQLCNADWQPVELSSFDYIKGFSQNRLNQYRISSIAKIKYIHYQVLLPENNCMPTKSGNYLLKVFLNGDPNQLAFTQRLLIADNFIPTLIQVQQPYNSEIGRTHQKIQFSLDIGKLNLVNPQQQLKVVVLQNYRWDNAITGMQPVFMRQNLYEYNGEKDFIFPAGKEYRWVDMQSFRFQSDRIRNVDMNVTPFEVEVAPDVERTQQRYLFYTDLNGFFEINTTDGVNPWWQGDYAHVHFTFVPANNQPYLDKNVYIAGQFTNYFLNDSTQMKFNNAKGVYETTLFLKQGYYTYRYVTTERNDRNAFSDQASTEGNYLETENDYTVLVYYQSLNGRYDELVGVTTINSRKSRTLQ